MSANRQLWRMQSWLSQFPYKRSPFSERMGQPIPRIKEVLDETVRAALLQLIELRIDDNSFGLKFPVQCPDGHGIIYNMAKRCPVARFDRGDYVKVEFESEVQGLPGEWMWVRVHHCDEERQVVFGTLDNEPVVNSEDLQLGEELAINYGKVREHKKPWEFRKN